MQRRGWELHGGDTTARWRGERGGGGHRSYARIYNGKMARTQHIGPPYVEHQQGVLIKSET